ncbi:MAG: hypothetical protein QOK21_1445 [Solirubrobacteraceae bacterium]|jgi:hypothetical protein|nr:hypothetical protein [Solirubrobacteraceae bacterium]
MSFLTAAADGTVIIWDVATRSPIGSPLPFAHDTSASVALSPRRLAIGAGGLARRRPSHRRLVGWGS